MALDAAGKKKRNKPTHVGLRLVLLCLSFLDSTPFSPPPTQPIDPSTTPRHVEMPDQVTPLHEAAGATRRA